MKQSGFFVSPKLYILGCSPDGKVVDLNAGSNGDAFGLFYVRIRKLYIFLEIFNVNKTVHTNIYYN